MKTRASHGWAISGGKETTRERYFYTGWFLTRKEAVKAHTDSLDQSWTYCVAKGDRVERVTIQSED